MAEIMYKVSWDEIPSFHHGRQGGPIPRQHLTTNLKYALSELEGLQMNIEKYRNPKLEVAVVEWKDVT